MRRTHILAMPESDDHKIMVEINTTPLIDVMLVLLIMLIITVPIQTHSIKIDMPSGQPPITSQPVVTIDIDSNGTISWNGTVIPDQANLETKILNQVINVATQPEIHIRPDKLASYKYVASVLASTQRLGASRIGIISGND